MVYEQGMPEIGNHWFLITLWYKFDYLNYMSFSSISSFSVDLLHSFFIITLFLYINPAYRSVHLMDLYSLICLCN